MIGLDTNVLLRYIIQDEPKQAKLAEQVIESQLSLRNPGFINQIVLCELVWVCESAYKFARDDIAALLQRVLETNVFIVERSDLAWKALERYRADADFPDALIGLTNSSFGCERTVTFDRRAARRRGMTLIGA